MNKLIYTPLILCTGILCLSHAKENAQAVQELANRQDRLQQETAELIRTVTDPGVAGMLEKCKTSMQDATWLLRNNNTGGATLAAQTDVIELIYQAAQQQTQCENGQCKPGAQAMMEMLRQMLGMDSPDGQNQGQQGQTGQQDEQPNPNSKTPGKKPSQGADGSSDMAAQSAKGVSSAQVEVHKRTVPKATGIPPAQMPAEFRQTLEAYNKALQR